MYNPAFNRDCRKSAAAPQLYVDAVEKPLFSRIIDTKKRRGLFHAVFNSSFATWRAILANCPGQIIARLTGFQVPFPCATAMPTRGSQTGTA